MVLADQNHQKSLFYRSLAHTIIANTPTATSKNYAACGIAQHVQIFDAQGNATIKNMNYLVVSHAQPEIAPYVVGFRKIISALKSVEARTCDQLLVGMTSGEVIEFKKNLKEPRSSNRYQVVRVDGCVDKIVLDDDFLPTRMTVFFTTPSKKQCISFFTRKPFENVWELRNTSYQRGQY